MRAIILLAGVLFFSLFGELGAAEYLQVVRGYENGQSELSSEAKESLVIVIASMYANLLENSNAGKMIISVEGSGDYYKETAENKELGQERAKVVSLILTYIFPEAEIVIVQDYDNSNRAEVNIKYRLEGVVTDVPVSIVSLDQVKSFWQVLKPDYLAILAFILVMISSYFLFLVIQKNITKKKNNIKAIPLFLKQESLVEKKDVVEVDNSSFEKVKKTPFSSHYETVLVGSYDVNVWVFRDKRDNEIKYLLPFHTVSNDSEERGCIRPIFEKNLDDVRKALNVYLGSRIFAEQKKELIERGEIKNVSSDLDVLDDDFFQNMEVVNDEK